MYYICKNSCKNFICFKTLIPLSTTVSVIQNPLRHNPLMVDYLINSYGISRDKAISAYSLFSSKTSPSNFVSLLEVLKQSGFSDTQIRNLISKRLRFLSFKVEKTQTQVFEDLGFSGSSLSNLILKNPNLLNRDIDNCLTPNIDFLRSLLHTNENVVKNLKKSSWLLTFDLRKIIGSNLEILRRRGVHDHQISKLLIHQPRFFTQKPDSLEDPVTWVDQFWVNQSPGLFIHAVYAKCTMSGATLAAKFNTYKSYGWSDSDIISVFRKAPKFLMLSEKNFREGMDFLLDELRF